MLCFSTKGTETLQTVKLTISSSNARKHPRDPICKRPIRRNKPNRPHIPSSKIYNVKERHSVGKTNSDASSSTRPRLRFPVPRGVSGERLVRCGDGVSRVEPADSQAKKTANPQKTFNTLIPNNNISIQTPPPQGITPKLNHTPVDHNPKPKTKMPTTKLMWCANAKLRQEPVAS